MLEGRCTESRGSHEKGVGDVGSTDCVRICKCQCGWQHGLLRARARISDGFFFRVIRTGVMMKITINIIFASSLRSDMSIRVCVM